MLVFGQTSASGHYAWPLAGVSIVLAVAGRDALARRVPNSLVLFAILWTFARRLEVGQALLAGAPAALLLFLALVVAYGYGWLGAADAKIGAAFAWMAGPSDLADYLAASAMACVLLSAWWLLFYEGLSWQGAAARVRSPARALERARLVETSMPLTLCFAVGTLWASRGGQLWTV